MKNITYYRALIISLSLANNLHAALTPLHQKVDSTSKTMIAGGMGMTSAFPITALTLVNRAVHTGGSLHITPQFKSMSQEQVRKVVRTGAKTSVAGIYTAMTGAGLLGCSKAMQYNNMKNVMAPIKTTSFSEDRMAQIFLALQ